MNAEQHPQTPSSWQGESQGPETATSSRAIKFGLIGSLAGTIAMDVVMVVESLIIGAPVDGFVALIGSIVGGGALVGVVLHLLMGSLLGLLFGIAVWQSALPQHRVCAERCVVGSTGRSGNHTLGLRPSCYRNRRSDHRDGQLLLCPSPGMGCSSGGDCRRRFYVGILPRTLQLDFRPLST